MDPQKEKKKKKKKKKKEIYKAMLYQGEELLGEVDIYPEEKEKIEVKEIRKSQFSQASERCPQLAVLHTITATGIKSFRAILLPLSNWNVLSPITTSRTSSYAMRRQCEARSLRVRLETRKSGLEELRSICGHGPGSMVDLWY